MGSRSSLVARGVARLGVAVGFACAVGSLTGCPTVDLGDTPTEVGLCNPAGGLTYFQNQIWPNYVVRTNAMTSCNRSTCHVAGGNGLDFPNPVDFPAAYRRSQIYLNCGTPDASPFLTKPEGGINPHGGGDIFPTTADPAVQIFLDWFK
jgi:hypothetical protein